MLQSGHVTSMLRAQKTMTASDGIGDEASQLWLTAASPIVRGHIWDFGPLLQEECVDLTAGSVNVVANVSI